MWDVLYSFKSMFTCAFSDVEKGVLRVTRMESAQNTVHKHMLRLAKGGELKSLGGLV